MNLRCKPDDIAVIVGSTRKGGALNGSFVRCIELMGNTDYWEVEPLSPKLREFFAQEGRKAVWDRRLVPIRDPGEHAKDETLSWLPVPSKEHA